MLRGAAILLIASALSLVGCAAEPASSDDSGAADEAISGAVTAGKVVTVSGDALRLRRTPELADAKGKAITKNILGLLPIGANVKITDATSKNGFYTVEVLTASVIKELGGISKGFVYGDFINKKAKEPVDNTVEGDGTGSHNNPQQAKVLVNVADCSAMKDDRGKAMAPTIEGFLASDEPYAVIGLDTNTFSYGMTADIAELDAKSAFNPNGIPIPLRIVKTAASSPDGQFTVTICAAAAVKAQLPAELNLTVYPDALP